MKLVSCYRASAIAQVSKQLISSHKKANQADKGKYPYFVVDKDTGKCSVDVESEAWSLYMQSRQLIIEYKMSGKKDTVKLTEDKATEDENVNRVYFKNLLNVAMMALDDVFKPTDNKRNAFLKKLAEHYKAMKK